MRFIIFIAILVAIILLQVFLSKRKNKWLGLILPIISFLFTLLIIPLNMVVPTTGVDMGYILKLIVTFVLFNIPTMIFMTIYLICRERKNNAIN